MKKSFLSIFLSVLLLIGATWTNKIVAQTTSSDGTNCAMKTLPWAYGFEEPFVATVGGNRTAPECWENFDAGDGSYYWTTKPASDAHFGIQCLHFAGIQNIRMQHRDWLITPEIMFTGNDEMSFWVKTGSTMSADMWKGKFSVYASTDLASGISDTANYTRLTITGVDVVDNRVAFYGKEWKKITVALPNTLTGAHHLAFVVDKNSYKFYMDDLYIYPVVNCATPTNVRMTSVGASTMSLAWTSGASSFTIYYDSSEVDFNQSLNETATDTVIELMGLESNTVYNISVQASCDDGELSNPSYPIPFSTSCALITMDELPFYEDFSDNEVGVNSQLDNCWVKGSNTATMKYPFVKSDGGRDDINSLVFNGTSASYCYAAMPAFEEDVSNLVLSCSVRRSVTTSKNSDLLVGLTRNPYDISEMVVYDTLSPVTPGEWTDFVLPLLDYSLDDGQYIVFKMDKGRTGEAYLDNVKIELNESSCDSPVDVAVNGVTGTSADVSWSDESGTNWRVYYGAMGFDTTGASYVDAGMPEVTIMGLTPQTTYEFLVVTDCGNGEYSMPSPRMSFTTTCAEVSTLPYMEDFESYESGETEAINPCWIKHCSDATEYFPYPSTTAAINGQNGLWLQAYKTTVQQYNSYVALPKFSEEITALRVNFKMKNIFYSNHSSEQFSKIALGMMSNPNDLTTFDTIQVFDMNSQPSGTVEQHEIAFDNYLGTGSYITFLALDVDNGAQHFAENNVFLDDIEVSLIPDCATPTNIVVDATTGNSIDLSWDGNASSFMVMYSTHEDMQDSTVVTTTYNGISLTNLNDYTYYYIKVASVCSGEESAWTLNPFVVRTEMDCGEGNDNYVDTIGVGTTADRFSVINGNDMYDNTCNWTIYTAEEMAILGLGGSNNQIRAISLQTKAANAPMSIKIYMATTNEDQFSADYHDTMTLNTMTLVYDGTKQFVANSWNELVLNTPFVYDGVSNLMIAFERRNAITDYTEFYYHNALNKTVSTYMSNVDVRYNQLRSTRGNIVFNVCGNIPVCERPSGLMVNHLTSTMVDLSWTGNATSYQLVYDDAAFNPNAITNQTTITVQSATATVNGLTPNTTYYMYVRSICNGSYSDWSLPIEINTPCDAMAVPYLENFDSYVGGTSVSSGQTINSCWVKGATDGRDKHPFVYSTESASPSNSLKFYATNARYSYAALPMFNEPLSNLMMSFKLYAKSNDYENIVVGVMTDPYDVATFQAIDSVKPSITKDWQEFDVTFNTYEGEGEFIAFMQPVQAASMTEMLLDDVEVYETPSCVSPVNVNISNITSNTALVSWTDRDENIDGGYELQYGPSGFVLGTGTTITSLTNPATISGLTSNMEYEVYVRAICAVQEESRWSHSVKFNTPCGAVALPIEYDFEDFESGYNSELPACVYRYNDATSTSPFVQNVPYIHTFNPALNAHSGTKYLYTKMTSSSTSAQNAGLVFPMIDTLAHPMNGNQLSFWGRATSIAEVFVGVFKDPTDFNTFVAIDSVMLTSSMEQYIIPFTSFNGYGGYPALMMKRESETYSSYIDDVRIEEIPACATVSDLRTMGVTNTTATIAWTDTIGTTSWVVEYHEKSSATVQSVMATSNPFTITGLSEKTGYVFNVRAICSTGDTTNPARKGGEFYTSQNPVSLPYTYNFEEGTEWANWQTSSNVVTANWYRGNAVAGEGSYAAYMSADQGVTRGSDWNAFVNAVAYRDVDFGIDSTSYVMTFKASVGGEVSPDIVMGVLLVDPSVEVISTGEAMTTPWGVLTDELALKKIRQDTNWTTYSVYFENVTGVKRVVFYWYNTNVGNSDPYCDKAAAIDDISIQEQVCVRPMNLYVTNVTDISATLNWEGESTEYEVAYFSDEDATNAVQIVNGNDLDIVALNPNIEYQYKVRAICSVADTSDWSDVEKFTTLCGRFSARDTIREDFTNYEGTSHNKQGVLPDCWESYADGLKGITPHVVDSGYSCFAHDDKALAMSAGLATQYGNMSVVKLPYTVEPVHMLKLTYWMCTESAVAGMLQVGYLTGENMATDFVAVDSVRASIYTQKSTSGNQPEGVGLYDTVYFENVPMTAKAVAFRWKYHTSTTTVCIDDVELTVNSVCFAPEITDVTADHSSVTVAWNGESDNYQLLYKSVEDTDWSDTINTSETNYTIDNLASETEYMVKLRSVCGVDGNSGWVDTMFTTGMSPCSVPSNLSSTLVGYDEVSLTWQCEGDILQWVVKVFNTMDTIIDTVDRKSISIAGLYSDVEYKALVKSLCGADRSSEWSDTISFRTKACASVTNIEVSEITTNSAVITWDDADVVKWEINYGNDIDLNGGEVVETTEARYTLTGLERATDYEIVIRSYCTENVYSAWSNKVRFTTKDGQERIDGVEGDFEFAIYPNPTSGVTTISLNGVEGKVMISIVDMNGRMVKSETMECGSDCEKRLDVANLAQGTYFVRVLGDEINSVRKLIVK